MKRGQDIKAIARLARDMRLRKEAREAQVAAARVTSDEALHEPTSEKLDATAERLSKGDPSEWVNPAEIDSSEQAIGRARRFRQSRVEMLYVKGRLTWPQKYAAEWYQAKYHASRFETPLIASYGERTSASEPAYGLPRTERQMQARQDFARARRVIPADMLGYVDRLVLHDRLPSLRNRGGQRTLKQLAFALDKLAQWLHLPSEVLPSNGNVVLISGDDKRPRQGSVCSADASARSRNGLRQLGRDT